MRIIDTLHDLVFTIDYEIRDQDICIYDSKMNVFYRHRTSHT